MPADGYVGSYMVDLAKEIISEEGDSFLKMPEAEGIDELGKSAWRRCSTDNRADLEMLGVTFDVWFSEQSLYDNDQYRDGHDAAEAGRLYRREGRRHLVRLHRPGGGQGQRGGAHATARPPTSPPISPTTITSSSSASSIASSISGGPTTWAMSPA